METAETRRTGERTPDGGKGTHSTAARNRHVYGGTEDWTPDGQEPVTDQETGSQAANAEGHVRWRARKTPDGGQKDWTPDGEETMNEMEAAGKGAETESNARRRATQTPDDGPEDSTPDGDGPITEGETAGGAAETQ